MQSFLPLNLYHMSWDTYKIIASFGARLFIFAKYANMMIINLSIHLLLTPVKQRYVEFRFQKLVSYNTCIQSRFNNQLPAKNIFHQTWQLPRLAVIESSIGGDSTLIRNIPLSKKHFKILGFELEKCEHDTKIIENVATESFIQRTKYTSCYTRVSPFKKHSGVSGGQKSKMNNKTPIMVYKLQATYIPSVDGFVEIGGHSNQTEQIEQKLLNLYDQRRSAWLIQNIWGHIHL